MGSIRVAIADDYKIYRDGLKVAIENEDGMDVVLEADDGEELLNALKTTEADVILMDLKMPVMDGLQATKEVKRLYPDIKILVVTMYEDDKFIIHLMEHGANGYLLKNADGEEIINAIHSAIASGYYFNELVNKALLKKLVHKRVVKPSFSDDLQFSERELDVLKLICAEKTAAEIGKEIFLSPRSVEGIRQRLIEKIGAKNTAGLVMYAVKHGICPVDEAI